MNSASRRDSINGNSSASPPSYTTPTPCVSNNIIGAIAKNNNGSISAGSDHREEELFERVGDMPPHNNIIVGAADTSASLPLKPSGGSGNTSPFTLQQMQPQQQMDQQAFCPSMSPMWSGGVGGSKAGPFAVDLKKLPSAEVGQAGGSVPSLDKSLPSTGTSGIKNDGTNANTMPLAGGLSLGNTLGSSTPNSFHGKGSFPLNLTLMLESVEGMKLSHIVSWLPGGQSFVIHDPDQFLTLVLPKFFKSSKNTKIRSFYRKLNRWGFSIIRGNHHAQLVAAGLDSLVADTPTKGVWNHPDFYRSRAVECLKIALETGDTTCFLTVTHGSAQGSNPSDENKGTTSEASTRKKRRSSASPSSPSLANSFTTASTDLSTFFGGSQRPSQRESDFSLGDDSTLDASLRTDEFVLTAAGARQQGTLSTALAHAQQRVPCAVAPPAYGMSNSFTSGFPVPAQAPSSVADASAAALGAANKRGRHSVAYSSSSTSFNYQPVTQSGMMGGNNRRGASWTAGSTFSQRDFDFPGLSFNPLTGDPDLQMPGGGGGHLEIDPLPFNQGNGNVDMKGSLMSMGMHQPPQPIQEGDGGTDYTPEDVELANFFEKFAESLQK